MGDERCETCRFWDQRHGGTGAAGDEDSLEDTDEPWGRCRRYPPRTTDREDADHYDSGSHLQPITLRGDWCGEWRAKT